MSRVKVNSINPFSGQNINFGGNAVPSGSGKTLGTESNPWTELYVSTSSIAFVTGNMTIARLRAGGQSLTSGIPTGQIFTEISGGLRGSFSIGRDNQASGTASLANGSHNTASGLWSHAEGSGSKAISIASHAEGDRTFVSGFSSHAEGRNTSASGNWSHAEGDNTKALGAYSHAEGQLSIALDGAHAEGYGTVASGAYAHSEGVETIARGDWSHAEGYRTLTSAWYSHAEGGNTIASGLYSHAEGNSTIASGQNSHAEGSNTVALGIGSHTEGLNTIASGSYQTVVGEWNTHNDTTSHFIVGSGTSEGTRKDAFKVTHSSSIVVATQSAAPSWTGIEGEIVPYVSGSVYRLYAYLGGAWRSSSFA